MKQSLLAIIFVFALVPSASPQNKPLMPKHATGTFDVKVTPQPPDETPDDNSRGRMLLEKQIHGDLEGVSKGQMLTGMGDAGSAVYVAIERITGTLHGHKGSFMLHHTGIATSAGQQLTITVIPDSGSDELNGIKGTMTITITGKQHFYDFEYTLP